MISRWTRFARGEDRLQLEIGERAQAVEARTCEEPADRNIHGLASLPEREKFFLEENPRGKAGKEGTVGIYILEGGELEAVFPREPAEHFLFRLRLDLSGVAQTPKHLGIHGGELLALHHGCEKVLA